MRATRYILYIYIIGIAFLLQGCRKESHPSTPDTKSYAISMSPSEVMDGTRALIGDVADLQDQGFKVYGYKVDKADRKQQVFTDKGQSVSYDDANGWSYDPVRYWDRVANYNFGAYAPATLTGGMTVTNNTVAANQTLTFTHMPQWQVADDAAVDLLVATSQGAATTYLNNAGGVVNLTFDHAYAQLVVRVVRGATLKNTYKLTSIAYSNVPTANGTATYTLDYTAPAASAWKEVEMLAADAWVTAYSHSGEVINSNPEDTPGAKHLVVPFALNGTDEVQVKVSYTVNDGLAQTGSASTGIKQMEAGKRYVLTLSLGSGATITPSLDIEQWIEVQDEQDIEVEEDDKHNW